MTKTKQFFFLRFKINNWKNEIVSFSDFDKQYSLNHTLKLRVTTYCDVRKILRHTIYRQIKRPQKDQQN